MLTVAQVAGSLNVHPHSVRRWADSGLLQCYRIGVRGDRRFNLNDIQVFLESSGRKRD
ncbi:MAG: DNA-binding protein [Planctomyces sp.]|nr:DNA-binding protein [Planctomyces sp.]